MRNAARVIVLAVLTGSLLALLQSSHEKFVMRPSVVIQEAQLPHSSFQKEHCRSLKAEVVGLELGSQTGRFLLGNGYGTKT